MYQDKHSKKKKKEKSDKMQRKVPASPPVQHHHAPGMPLGITALILCPFGHSGPDIQEEGDQRCDGTGDTQDDQQRKGHFCLSGFFRSAVTIIQQPLQDLVTLIPLNDDLTILYRAPRSAMRF